MHTKGPWLLTGDERMVYALQSAGYRKGIEQFENRFDVCVQGPHCDLTELRANARLIAAAPELLDCCRRALAAWDGTGPAIVLDDLRSVIAKAEGKS